jgi:hypothetical protein
LPTFAFSKHEMFIDAARYATSANLTSTTLTLVISETPYYIKNVQSPIAQKPEVLFRTLLFSFLCLEMCAMTFLIAKLLVLPVFHRLDELYSRRGTSAVRPAKTTNTDH